MKTTTALRLSVLGILVAITTHAGAEQCIFNSAGFTATVRWYDAKAVTVTQGTKTIERTDPHTKKKEMVEVHTGTVNPVKHPLGSYEVMAGQYSCTNSHDNLIATIAVKDGKAATLGTKIGLSALIAAGAVGVCVGTGGAGCAMAVDLVPEGIGAVSQFLPDAKNVFYVDVPKHSSGKHRNVLKDSAFNPSVNWDKVTHPDSFKKGRKL
jgi:hypothetical protein